MSVAAAKDFLKRVRSDEKFAQQMKACKNVPEFLEASAKAGFIVSQEDLTAADSKLEEWINVGAGVWGHSVVGKSECVDYTLTKHIPLA